MKLRPVIRKTDGTHAAIREALRDCGFSAEDTHIRGRGFPDLCIGAYGWLTLLIEVKPKGPPSAQKLTPDEKRFHANWRGMPVVVASTPQEAIHGIERSRELVRNLALGHARRA